MSETYGTVILAGGQSARMNYPKIFLRVNGKTFLQKIVETYSNALINNLCLVINEKYYRGEWKMKVDSLKPFISALEITSGKQGRFHSLKLGIKNLLSCDFVYIQNADNPFVDKEVIEQLQKNRNPGGWTQVVYKGKGGHPVLISKKITTLINDVDDEDYNLRDLLQQFPKTEAEGYNEGVLVNINTMEDYEKYL